MIKDYQLDHLDELEAESMFVLREVAAQFERPAILFSGGKDSIVVTHLAAKAFAPARIPMPLVHIDTGHNFPETIEFRDHSGRSTGRAARRRQCARHHRRRTRSGRDPGRKRAATACKSRRCWRPSKTASTTPALAARGAMRRRPARRNGFSATAMISASGIPKTNGLNSGILFNGKHMPGENFRVFPLNNWTELDIWNYITREKIDLPSLYYAHERMCVVGTA